MTESKLINGNALCHFNCNLKNIESKLRIYESLTTSRPESSQPHFHDIKEQIFNVRRLVLK